jgi:hypothetical protein
VSKHPFITIISLAMALLFSQVPEFAQQYGQRLGGAVDELDRIVRQFDEDSRRSGYDRSAALGVMANNSERLVRDQSTRMSENVSRLDYLKKQQIAFRDGGSVVRFTSLLTYFDRPMMKRTFDNFVWAVPLTIESGVLALIGFLASFGLLVLGTLPFRSRMTASV